MRALPSTGRAGAMDRARSLIGAGRHVAAVPLLTDAMARHGGDAEMATLLAQALELAGDGESAARVLGDVCRALPLEAPAWFNLGTCLLRQRCSLASRAAFRRAVILVPAYAPGVNSLASVTRRHGEAALAVRLFRWTTVIQPGRSHYWSNLVFTHGYAAGTTAGVLSQLESAWAETLATTTAGPPPVLRPRRRGHIRLAYLSGDLRAHPTAHFFEGLLRHHDAAAFAVTVLHDSGHADQETLRLRGLGGTWHDVSRLDDAALARHIDGLDIDILVDLQGHTDGNRLPLLARRVAPMQVVWVGWHEPVGLASIDYRIGDGLLHPLGTAPGEPVLRLEGPWMAYTPPSDAVPALEAPWRHAGVVTLGGMQNLAKVNDAVLDAWAAVLRAAENTRLHLTSRWFREPGMRAWLHRRLADRGVDPARVVLLESVSVADHIRRLAALDLSLDSFPYNGVTTSFETLAMGVPIVALRGAPETPVTARVTASLLDRVGLSALACASVADYVETAVRLATHPDALDAARDGLAERCRVAGLTDTRRHVAEFEAALKLAWGGIRPASVG